MAELQRPMMIDRDWRHLRETLEEQAKDLAALLRTWDQPQLIAALIGALALGVCEDPED